MEDVGKELRRIINKRNYQEEYVEVIAEILNDADVQAFLSAHQEELTQADTEKSYAKLYELVQGERKYQKNDPTMIAPGYESKLTLNFYYMGVTYVPTKASLARQRQEEVKSRVKTMDVLKDIQSASFENLERTDGRGYASLEALDFVEEYTADPKGYHGGLYLVGSFGIGKTYSLEATARELAIAEFTMTLVYFPTFAVEMKQAIGKGQVVEKLDAVKRSPILMIDDIGAGAMGSWIRDEIFDVILQYRMQEQSPTFFSSSFAMDELEQHLPVTRRGGEESLKAKRIMERIRYLTKETEMAGRNRRNGWTVDKSNWRLT